MANGSGRASVGAIVIEANEVPPRIFRKFAAAAPSSHIARLLREARVLTTEARDVRPGFLYPSQTYASLNTGVPYDRHRIHWYNDPKPPDYPLYWRIMARRGYRVGLVNSLHTSPLDDLMNDDHIAFLIPEVFAATPDTKPAAYRRFQQFHQQLTNENRRVAATTLGMREALMALQLPSLGVTPGTMVRVARIVAGAMARRVTKERLRNVPFMLTADMFMRLLSRHDVDLALFFTNHVASNMHRYWHALFPDEAPADVYKEEWVTRHAQEIPFALDLLDVFIGRVMDFARATGRVLIVNSGMGQCSNPTNDTNRASRYLLRDPGRFLATLGVPRHAYEMRSAMAPQHSFEFVSAHEADRAFRTLDALGISTARRWLDVNGNVLTISVRPDWVDSMPPSLAATTTPGALGLVSVDTKDNYGTGRHHPNGILVIDNGHAPAEHQDRSSADYLEYAPAVLEFFGAPRPGYMIEPSFAI